MAKIKVEVEYITQTQAGTISTITPPTGTGTIVTDNVENNAMFITTQESGVDNVFSPELSFTVTGTSIKQLLIVFDRTNNEYATDMVIDGNTITGNTSTEYLYKGATGKSSIVVKITKWSKPNATAKITAIVAKLKLSYQDEKLSFVKRGSKLLNNIKTPSYGVVSQYGNVDLVDTTKIILSFAYLGILQDGSIIKVFFGTNQIGQYVAYDWKYSYENNLVSVDLECSLKNWNDIIISNYYAGDIGVTAFELYTYLKSLAVGKTFSVDSLLLSEFKKIRIQNFFINNLSLFSAFDNFGYLTQCVIFENELGVVEVVKYE